MFSRQGTVLKKVTGLKLLYIIHTFSYVPSPSNNKTNTKKGNTITYILFSSLFLCLYAPIFLVLSHLNAFLFFFLDGYHRCAHLFYFVSSSFFVLLQILCIPFPFVSLWFKSPNIHLHSPIPRFTSMQFTIASNNHPLSRFMNNNKKK